MRGFYCVLEQGQNYFLSRKIYGELKIIIFCKKIMKMQENGFCLKSCLKSAGLFEIKN